MWHEAGLAREVPGRRVRSGPRPVPSGAESHEVTASGNGRRGLVRKKVLADSANLDIGALRDQNGSFQLRPESSGHRCLPGFDEKAVSLYDPARSWLEICVHLWDFCNLRVCDGPVNRAT